ncbi:MAG: hypothetical protein M1834_007449 [Cirrosporium novae-zelandiae]|nr:MAG: hypothetical protein M1834_007449 [Cirrosporium novae-zelandiae]
MYPKSPLRVILDLLYISAIVKASWVPAQGKMPLGGRSLIAPREADTCSDLGDSDCDCETWGASCDGTDVSSWVGCDDSSLDDTWPDCTASELNSTSSAISSQQTASLSSTNSSIPATSLSSANPSAITANITSGVTASLSSAPITSSSDGAAASSSAAAAAAASSSEAAAAAASSSEAAAAASSSEAAAAASSSEAAAASASSASAASAASASAAAATATPTAQCGVNYKVFYYKVSISNIKNWDSDDVEGDLKKQESGCGALTDWSWHDDEGDGASVTFQLPPIIKKGCPGRAIGSAGGPDIDC